MCWSSFFNEVAACNFIKKRLQHRRFLVNIAKLLRTPILKNNPGGCYFYLEIVILRSDLFLQILSGLSNVICEKE